MYFYGTVKSRFVPEREIKDRKSDWMTTEILQLIRRKRRLWKHARYGQNVQEYEEVAKSVAKKVRNAKRQMEQRLARDKTNNKKPFYNYVRKKTRSRDNVGPLTGQNGNVITDPAEMAEELNKCFSEVFMREDVGNLPRPKQPATRTYLRNTFITAQKVRQQIKNLKPSGAAGPDGITTKFLQQCAEELSPALACIYRKSLAQGKVPEEWKLANVVPIYKKGSKAVAGNYRPISLTCICCKVMESILKEDIVQHLKRNNIISKSQHGFTRGRSCTTNLLEFMEHVTKAADTGQAVDVIYLDFAKAFDKVPLQRLISKLSAAGIRGNVLTWIGDWLTERRQRVVINGKYSGWRAVLSGVPQGSILGTVLFNIFINDLDEAATIKQMLKKFADDTKICQIIQQHSDTVELQATLNRLCEWATTWGMQFNVQKCHVMHVGPANPRNSYTMNGERLATTEVERDVGVSINCNLKPTAQCKKAAQTASTVLAQILRAFHYRDRHTYLNLYKQYVRPHLEFATPVWAPWNRSDIDALERVQERAVRAVSGLRGRSYTERLSELELQSLAERQVEADMLTTFKIMSDSDTEYRAQWFQKMDNTRPTRFNSGHNNLVQGRAGHNFRREFFSLRVPHVWNVLPDTVKEAKTAAAFKSRYRQYNVERVAQR
jgi:Reverse transcriptase (RNA-dependent DNA polymerase)